MTNYNSMAVATEQQFSKWKPNRKPLAQHTLNASATLWHRCRLSDKLSILFKLSHARWFNSQFLIQY